MTIRILLVDDHQIFREALRYLLEKMPDLHVVGDVGDGKELVRLVRELTPDIVCIDIAMPESAVSKQRGNLPQLSLKSGSLHFRRMSMVYILLTCCMPEPWLT